MGLATAYDAVDAALFPLAAGGRAQILVTRRSA
jgi:hypothetical protein